MAVDQTLAGIRKWHLGKRTKDENLHSPSSVCFSHTHSVKQWMLTHFQVRCLLDFLKHIPTRFLCVVLFVWMVRREANRSPPCFQGGGPVQHFETPNPRLRPLLRLALEPRHLLKCPRERAARHLKTPGRIDSKAVRSLELIWPWVTSPVPPQ